MNYNDTILDNKEFNIFKQLICYIAVALCIILAGCLVIVYGFGYKPYKVLTGSMAPIFVEDDIVVVKAKDEYKVGDILTFKQGNSLVTHRLVAIATKTTGEKVYLCHGDAVDSANPNWESYSAPWEKDVEYLKTLTNEELLNDTTKTVECQRISEAQIVGKVVTHIDDWGKYIDFISVHKFLIIGLIIGIWCVIETIQNEIWMKKTMRLL